MTERSFDCLVQRQVPMKRKC